MISVSVSEARNNFSKLLDRVREGESVSIQNRGKEVAVLNPPTAPPEHPDFIKEAFRKGLLMPPKDPSGRMVREDRKPYLAEGETVAGVLEILLKERENGR